MNHFGVWWSILDCIILEHYKFVGDINVVSVRMGPGAGGKEGW